MDPELAEQLRKVLIVGERHDVMAQAIDRVLAMPEFAACPACNDRGCPRQCARGILQAATHHKLEDYNGRY